MRSFLDFALISAIAKFEILQGLVMVSKHKTYMDTETQRDNERQKLDNECCARRDSYTRCKPSYDVIRRGAVADGNRSHAPASA